MSNSNPLVSIIALNYNQSKYLIESLNSFVNQSYKNFELIITDDASTDDSREKILNWEIDFPEIKIIKCFNDQNLGLCKTLNKAISLSSGEFIKPIACDDVLETQYLDKVLSYFQSHTNIDLLCTDMKLISDRSEVLQESNWKYSGMDIKNKNINDFESYLRGPYLNTPSFIYRKSLYDKLGGYDEELAFEDWDFILRAKRISEFGFINESLLSYRVHDSNMHRNIGRLTQYTVDIISLLKKHIGISAQTDEVLRNQISDELNTLLILDENKALQVWEELVDFIKLKNINEQVKMSIVCTVYNAENYIKNSIKCVKLQSYSQIEFVIVTDPCTDRTVEIIKEFSQEYPHIKLVENQEHLGLIASLNRGLDHCTGKYIARMDLDDLIHPLKFEKQIHYLESHPDCHAVSTEMYIFNEVKEKQRQTFRKDADLHRITLLFFPPIPHAPTVFRAECIKELRYKEGYNYAEDYNLWTRFLQVYNTSIIQEPLYLYRTHSQQTTNEKNLQKQISTLKKILNDIFKFMGIQEGMIDLDFYVDALMLSENLKNKEELIKFDSIMQEVYKANKKVSFLNEEKFKDYVFKNYWQSNFLKYMMEIGSKDWNQLAKSPFNLFEPKTKLKFRAKKLLGI